MRNPYFCRFVKVDLWRIDKKIGSLGANSLWGGLLRRLLVFEVFFGYVDGGPLSGDLGDLRIPLREISR